MKKIFYVLFVLSVFCSLTLAQKAKIKTEPVTPHMVTEAVVSTNSVSAGLDIAPNGTYVYLSPQNIGNTEPITDFEFTLTSVPTGSAAAIEIVNTNWAQFQVDVKGAYVVNLSITTASGTHDTSKTIYSADWVGVGNFEGVAGSFPKCMTCHASNPTFSAIFDDWKVSGHAIVFQREIDVDSALSHYSTNCMKCHTTGYDHNVVADNGGFDDVAADLGWVYPGYTNPGMWDSIKTNYSGLVNLATIGCEMCHGPGGEHATGSTPKLENIAVSLEAGSCAQCHDEPWRHNKVAEYENSLHSEALWSNSFKRETTNNSLSNCARCHEAEGYVTFTKDEVFNSVNLTQADHVGITCATCHDPHSLELREAPAASDTLANAFNYTTIGGSGQTCMNCHKARLNSSTISASTSINSHWGPHHSTQTDVLLGKNAAEFGTPYQSGSAHSVATADACVTCHMASDYIPGQTDENRNYVAGHSFSMHNPGNGYDHTASCTGCHGSKASFEDFVSVDYDYDGTVESVQEEIDGLITMLRTQLPPAGFDSIDIAQINTENLKKAYYNYQLIAYDGSRGVHNTKFAVDVLTKSFLAIDGVIPVELISFNAELSGEVVSLNWQTATEKNNRGFDVQKKVGTSWNTVGFVQGKGTTSEIQQYSFSEKLSGLANGTKVTYRLKQMDYDGSIEYSNEVEITYVGGPKEYTLDQNYPNPFNPVTTIKYSLPYESKVKVIIYNIAGEVVAELLNTVQASGSQELRFDTSKLSTGISSGIYFYSLEASSLTGEQTFREVKKMVLMK